MPTMNTREEIPVEWDGEEAASPTAQPLVKQGGIVTFADQFLDGFDAPTLPAGVAADVAFLRAWLLPPTAFYGPETPLHPFTCAAAATTTPTVLPTAAAVLAALRVVDFRNPTVDLDQVAPPLERRFTVGIDYIHADVTQNNCLFWRHEAGQLTSSAVTEGRRADMRASARALAALRAYVRDGHVYFANIHPLRGEGVGPDENYLAAVALFWAVGVSPASGNLVGAWALNECYNVCD